MFGGIGTGDDDGAVTLVVLFLVALCIIHGRSGLNLGRVGGAIFEFLGLVDGETGFFRDRVFQLGLGDLDDSCVRVRGRHVVTVGALLGPTTAGDQETRAAVTQQRFLEPWRRDDWNGFTRNIRFFCILDAFGAGTVLPPPGMWQAVAQFEPKLVLLRRFICHSRKYVIATGSTRRFGTTFLMGSLCSSVVPPEMRQIRHMPDGPLTLSSRPNRGTNGTGRRGQLARGTSGKKTVRVTQSVCR